MVNRNNSMVLMILVLLCLACATAIIGAQRCHAETPAPGNAQEDEFSFIVFGDTRPSGSGAPFTPALYRMLEEFNLLGPDIVLHTGDMIWCYDEKDEEVASEYVNAMALFSGLEAPLFFTPGNHEYLTAFAAREFHRVTKQKEWFSFDHKGAHFIVLNTELSGQQGDITGGQRAWLEEDLNRSTNARAVFVVMHRAMYSRLNPDFNPKGKPNMVSMERRDGLADLFSRHRVSAVFCGHEHLYAKTVHKGVTYFTIGGGGAPFAAPVESGGFLSYMIVTVKGRDVAFDLMEPYHFFVRKRTFREKGKTVGEAVVENICNDDCVLRLRGIKLTLPAADYRLEADTVPPSSQLGDWAIKVNAAITAVKKSRRNHREVDVHITVDSPGAYVLRLTVRPAAGRASPHLRTRRIAPESLCAPQLR